MSAFLGLHIGQERRGLRRGGGQAGAPQLHVHLLPETHSEPADKRGGSASGHLPVAPGLLQVHAVRGPAGGLGVLRLRGPSLLREALCRKDETQMRRL